MVPNELHVTHLPCRNGEEFSLIIPKKEKEKGVMRERRKGSP
jgi:hypothetical protein